MCLSICLSICLTPAYLSPAAHVSLSVCSCSVCQYVFAGLRPRFKYPETQELKSKHASNDVPCDLDAVAPLTARPSKGLCRIHIGFLPESSKLYRRSFDHGLYGLLFETL